MSDRLLDAFVGGEQKTKGFSHFVTLMTASVASGWTVAGLELTPTGKRYLSTAHTRCGHGHMDLSD